MGFWPSLVLSFLIVAFGQPARIPGFGMAAACLGFALFWHAMLRLPTPRGRFFLSLIWYAAVHGVQLSWMTSSEYMGPCIYGVYFLLILGVGAQFGLLSLFVRPPFTFFRCLGIAGMWVWFEWVRLYFLSGFTWNPVGLALADSSYAIQWASVLGIYGLSFWVILVNMVGLRFLTEQKRAWSLWASLALFPYAFGWIYQSIVDWRIPHEKTLSVALVQTALLPEQKDYWRSRSKAYIPPLDQWERIFALLKTDQKLDLIVLPEAAFPFGSNLNYYPIDIVKAIWIESFGTEALSDLPSIEAPYGNPNKRKVNNLFLAQALSNHYRSNLILGLDALDAENSAKYNAAFYLKPKAGAPQRYEKRVLVPVGEYRPLSSWGWLAELLSNEFGIGDTFDPGTKVTIFDGPPPIGVTICLEEIYSGLIRDLRLHGANLFVNISNDVWFPNSLLAEQHFDHGRVRAVENGVYIVRAGNTGVTGAIDCFGQPLKRLTVSNSEAGVLFLSLPIRHVPTAYTWWGDQAILAVSLASILISLRRAQNKKLL